MIISRNWLVPSFIGLYMFLKNWDVTGRCHQTLCRVIWLEKSKSNSRTDVIPRDWSEPASGQWKCVPAHLEVLLSVYFITPNQGNPTWTILSFLQIFGSFHYPNSTISVSLSSLNSSARGHLALPLVFESYGLDLMHSTRLILFMSSRPLLDDARGLLACRHESPWSSS
jgi:hypothetical protein